MECSAARGKIGAWRDGELDRPAAAAVASHVEACPSCSALSRAHAALGETLRDPSLTFEPPPRLAERVAWLSRRRRPRTAFLPWAAAMAAGFLLGMGLTAWRGRSIRADALAAELAGNQVRALQPGRLTDVLSSDQHTVKPWFAGKLDFSPPVKDLAAAGFPLLGGRVDAVAGRPVAALVYARRRHVINLYVCPAAGMPDAVASGRNGFHVRHWRDGEMAFWAVSDLDPRELDRFAELVRSGSS